MNLIEKRCQPVTEFTPPLSPERKQQFLKELRLDWQCPENKKLVYEFTFDDPKHTSCFVGDMDDIAESEQHHPEYEVMQNKVVVQIWTHVINDLTENDFILARKIERLITSI